MSFPYLLFQVLVSDLQSLMITVCVTLRLDATMRSYGLTGRYTLDMSPPLPESVGWQQTSSV